jgi:hypothetical protein
VQKSHPKTSYQGFPSLYKYNNATEEFDGLTVSTNSTQKEYNGYCDTLFRTVRNSSAHFLFKFGNYDWGSYIDDITSHNSILKDTCKKALAKRNMLFTNYSCFFLDFKEDSLDGLGLWAFTRVNFGIHSL